MDVTIENDDLLEIDECLRTILELVNAVEVGHILFQPGVATVTILQLGCNSFF